MTDLIKVEIPGEYPGEIAENGFGEMHDLQKCAARKLDHWQSFVRGDQGDVAPVLCLKRVVREGA